MSRTNEYITVEHKVKRSLFMNYYKLIKFKDNEFELDVNVSPEEDAAWLTKDEIVKEIEPLFQNI